MEIWGEVDRYYSDLLIPRDEVLEEALRDSDAAGLPSIAVSPLQGRLLTLLAQTVGAMRILEIGTLGGYSTICLARGLGEGGRLISLEYERKHADVAQANIARAGLSGVVEVMVGKAIDNLPELDGPFDLIFLDADKVSYPEYFEWAVKLAQPGTLILADNVVRNGAVIDPESKDANVQGVRRFNQLVAAEKRVMATAIQTVGSKGYDGLAVIRVI